MKNLIRKELLQAAELDFEIRKLELTYGNLRDEYLGLKKGALVRKTGVSPTTIYRVYMGDKTVNAPQEIHQAYSRFVEVQKELAKIEIEWVELKEERNSYNSEEIGKRYNVSRAFVSVAGSSRLGWGTNHD